MQQYAIAIWATTAQGNGSLSREWLSSPILTFGTLSHQGRKRATSRPLCEQVQLVEAPMAAEWR